MSLIQRDHHGKIQVNILIIIIIIIKYYIKLLLLLLVDALLSNTSERSKTVTLVFERPIEEST